MNLKKTDLAATYLDLIDEQVLLLDSEFKIIQANKAAIDFFSENNEEIYNIKCQDICPFRKVSDNHICPAIEAKEKKNIYLNELVTHSGEIWTVKAYPMYNKQNQLDGFVEVMVNITNRKTIEKELQERDEMFTSIIQHSPRGFVAFKGQNNIVITNPILEKMLGYSHEELKEKTLLGITHPEDIEMSKNVSDKALKDQTAAIFEKRYITKDGDILPARVVTWGTYDEEGNWNYNFGSIEDIRAQKESELALKKSEERYRELVETMTEGLVIVDSNNTVEYSNPALSKILGYTRNELVGKKIFNFIPEEDMNIILNQIERRKRGEETQKYNLSLTKKDGSNVHVKISPKRVYDEKGEFDGSVAIITDITELKQTMMSLAISEEKYATLFKHARDGFILVNTDGTVRDINDAVLGMGYERSEWIGKDIRDIDPYHNKEFIDQILDVIKKEKEVGYTTSARYKDGTKIEVEVSATLITLENDEFIFSVNRDITKRVKAEEELRKSEEKFRSIVETSNEWIWEADLEGISTYTNSRIFDLLGYKPEEIMGVSVYEFMTEDEAKRVQSFYGEYAKDKQPFYRLEMTWQHKNGKPVFLESSAVPVIDEDGNLIGYRGVDRDITERKQAEAELRKSEELANAILNNTLQLNALLTPDGKIAKINKRGLDFQGLEEKDVLGTFFWEMPMFSYDKNRQETTKDSVLRASKGETIYNEVEQLVSSGKKLNMYFSIHPIKNVEGEILYLLPEAIDITERVKAEENYHNLVETAKALICKLDKNGNTLFVNSYVKDVTGYETNELIGRNWWEILYPGELHAQVDELLEIFVESSVFNHEMTLKMKNGEFKTLSWTDYAIRDQDENIVEINGVGIDITLQIQTEKSVKELRRSAYSQIENNIMNFAILVDQIRNPLAVIVGAAETRNLDFNDKIIENAAKIDKITKTMTESWEESEKFRQILHEQLLKE